MTIKISARAVRSALTNHGYIVFRGAVPPLRCQAVLDAIGHELDIWVDDPSSWRRISHEVDQVPLWGHQSQWDIRQLPDLHAIWRTVWGTDSGSVATHAGSRLLGVKSEPRPCRCTGTSTHVTVTASGFRG